MNPHHLNQVCRVEDHKELDRTSGSLFLSWLESSLEFVEFTIFGLNPFIVLFIDRHFHCYINAFTR